MAHIAINTISTSILPLLPFFFPLKGNKGLHAGMLKKILLGGIIGNKIMIYLLCTCHVQHE